MKPRVALINLYQPPRKGFTIYPLPNGVYQALRYIRPGQVINRRFFSVEECYDFLKKHEHEIIPDPLERSIHLPASAYACETAGQ